MLAVPGIALIVNYYINY